MNSNWEEILNDRLQLYGHRDWLVIADSAYPAQVSPGIETVVANQDHCCSLSRIFAAIRASITLKPTIYTDEELKFVAEEDAPGGSSFRQELGNLLKGYAVRSLPHEAIIAKLDRAGKMFRVLLIKINIRIPYTSVFFELQCGYWNAQAEKRLRAQMRSESRHSRAPRHKGRR
jgi:hypothetical protein